MIKNQKLKSFTIMILGLISLMCLLSLFPPSYTPKAASSGTEIATADSTNYYMHIPLTKAKGVHSSSVTARAYPDSINAIQKLTTFSKRTVATATVIFTFCNAKIDNYSVIATTLVTMEFPCSANLPFGLSRTDIVFTNDVTVNIRKEYFDFLKDQDISEFYMTVLLNGNGTVLWNKSIGAEPTTPDKKTFKASVELADNNTKPADWEDDLNPLGDNGGVTEVVDKKTDELSGWQKFLEMVGGFFGVSAVIAGGIVIGGGIILLKIIFK